MINKDYFKKTNEMLNVFLNIAFEETKNNEFINRKNSINKKYADLIRVNNITKDYITHAHEIKSYQFLKKYGLVSVAKDSKSAKGPDFKLLKYHIECVCCTSGDTTKNGLDNYRLTAERTSIVYDTNKKNDVFYSRITQSLNEKCQKFRKYIEDGTVQDSDPCIIFFVIRGYRY